MKQFILIAGFFAPTSLLMSQDCSTYFFLQNNKTIEMTITNKKGNVSGKNIYTVSNVSGSGNARTATLNSEFFDTKGKSISKSVNNIKCANGVMMMDMKVFIPAGQQEQMQTGTAAANEVYLEYPVDMKIGDNLKDGHFNMDYVNSSGLKSSIDINITERKVEGKESVTTSAGTWDCFKISANNKITARVAGIGFPIKSSVTEWFAPGFGVVKTESSGGKTEITSIK
jgi:hypothetical protein